MIHRVGPFDILVEKHILQTKLPRAEEKLSTINVPFVDWDKLGESFMSAFSSLSYVPSLIKSKLLKVYVFFCFLKHQNIAVSGY